MYVPSRSPYVVRYQMCLRGPPSKYLTQSLRAELAWVYLLCNTCWWPPLYGGGHQKESRTSVCVAEGSHLHSIHSHPPGTYLCQLEDLATDMQERLTECMLARLTFELHELG